MIKINCKKCLKNCCGQIKNLRPILIPSEEKRFKKYSDVHITKFRKLLILKQKKNGNCIFLNDKTKRCTIYSKRPLECKIYPYLLCFQRSKPDVYLDKRYCQSLKTLKANINEIKKFILKFEFPKDWIKAHNSTEGRY